MLGEIYETITRNEINIALKIYPVAYFTTPISIFLS